MKSMKVLFVNREKRKWTGGDYFQMERTAEELRKLGHQVTIVELAGEGISRDISEYDIIHGFNFSMGWSKWLMNNQKLPHQKFVMSMIYHELDDFASYPDQQFMYDRLDAAIFLNQEEVERISRHIKVNPDKHHLVENGIDDFWFVPQSKFLDPRKQKYVLCVGRNDSTKGQRFVAEACAELGIRFYSIGGNMKKKFGKNTLLPDMPQSELVKWYANCSVFVLASKNELMPLTVMEAGAQAKNIVLTKHCGWQIPGCEYVEHGDVVGIVNAIKKSLEKEPNYDLRDMLRSMTWEKAAKEIDKIYKQLYAA